MIKLEYICDNCGEFSPYLPSKSSSITCRKCHYNENIPEPTKLGNEEYYVDTWTTSSMTGCYSCHKVAWRTRDGKYLIKKDVTTDRLDEIVDSRWSLLRLNEKVCIVRAYQLVNIPDEPNEGKSYTYNFDPNAPITGGN